MNGPSRAAALPRTPAVNPAETLHAGQRGDQPGGAGDGQVVRADRQGGPGVHQRPVLGPAGHPGRGQPDGDRRRIPGTASRRPGTRSPTAAGAARPRTPAASAGCPAPARRVRSWPQQPHAAGPHSTVSPGSGDCRSVEDSAPGCFPGLRPDVPRSDRSRGFFLYGLSDDGGFDDVPESLSSRRRSSYLAASAATCASRAASCAAASSSRSRAACRSRALTSSSSATRARSHATSSGAGRGVSGTSRTTPQPASSYQRDTPNLLAGLSQHPSRQSDHRSLRLNSYGSSV